MIQDPVLVFAYLAAVVALVFQVARLPALRPVFDRLPALVWTYFLPMLSTTAGILPAESPVYRAIARYLLPASLSLLPWKIAGPAGGLGAFLLAFATR